MLINKLLLEYRYMIVRSIDFNYLKYIMDFDLMPIVRWTMVEGKWKYICISYGELSMLKKRKCTSLYTSIKYFRN